VTHRVITFLLVLALIAITLTYGSILGEHGRPLRIYPYHGIGALELTFDPNRAETIVTDVWPGLLHDIAIEDIRYDFVFILMYAVTLGIAAWYGSIVLAPWRLARWGRRLAWAMLVAGVCDVLENLGMCLELSSHVYCAARGVFIVSSVKWIFSLITTIYVLIVLPVWAGNLLLGQDGVERQHHGG
jgi:hypothetical protein